jgi:hypothetical protein
MLKAQAIRTINAKTQRREGAKSLDQWTDFHENLNLPLHLEVFALNIVCLKLFVPSASTTLFKFVLDKFLL